MKKALFLVLSLAFLLTACGETTPPDTSEQNPAGDMQETSLPESCLLYYDLGEASVLAEDKSLPLAQNAGDGYATSYSVWYDGEYQDLALQDGDNGISVADMTGGSATFDYGAGLVVWNGERYHCAHLTAQDSYIPNITPNIPGGILLLEVSGDCWADGGTADVACFTGFGTVVICGSGTLLIEAAQKAMNIAPGLKRRFAAERYGFVPAAIWAEQRQKALAEAKLDVGFEAFGYDIDPAAVALANANAKLAGVEKRCHFEVADVADFAAKQEAIVLTNPPYGERMSTIEGAAKLARTLGQQMAEHPCAGLYAITADMEFESHYGKRANKRRKMYNGMIPCQLYMYYEAPKFEHKAKPMPKQGFDGKRTVEFKKK